MALVTVFNEDGADFGFEVGIVEGKKMDRQKNGWK
jgi:hypothetical protein